MNFAEMSIKRPRSEHTTTHTPILGIRNRGVFWVKIAHNLNCDVSNLQKNEHFSNFKS